MGKNQTYNNRLLLNAQMGIRVRNDRNTRILQIFDSPLLATVVTILVSSLIDIHDGVVEHYE